MPKAVFENVDVDAGGRFGVSIVGESYYQEALGKIDKGGRGRGEDVRFQVCLFPEPDNPHDPNAVKVLTADAEHIGYLARDDALAYTAVVRALFDKQRFLSCPAKLVGGTSADRPNFGVVLDLPSPTSIRGLASRLVPGSRDPASDGSEPRASGATAEWQREVSQDAIDGTVIHTRTVRAVETFPISRGKEVIPRLVIRAKQPNPSSCILDCFVLFGPNFLPRRNAVAVRWRLDQHDPERADWNSSTSRDALFPSGGFDEIVYLIFRMRLSKEFVFETERKDGSRCVCHFGLGSVGEEFTHMLLACGIPNADELGTLRPGLIDHVLRIGPRNTVLLKKALQAAGAFEGPVDEAKGSRLYQAVRTFAQSAHVAEVFGQVEQRKGFLGLSTNLRSNPPFSIAVMSRAPRRVQEEMGPLKIFD